MLFSNLFVKNVVQDLTSAGIDWQREKWQSGLGSKFIHQGEKNAAKYADEVIVLSKGVQDYIGIYKMSNPDIRLCRYGQYNLGESKEFQLSNVDSTACRDLVISGDYNYVLFKNELRVQGKNDEVIGTLSGLGNTVHMCAVNEKTLAITARENDVYLVDVSDGMLYRFGLIDMPDKVNGKMKRAGRQM